jgi:hypothetical protein
MNLEDLEFEEGKGALESYLATHNSSINDSIHSIGGIAYWRRTECIIDLTFSITTLAHGGTKHAGRKLYEASAILGIYCSLTPSTHIDRNMVETEFKVCEFSSAREICDRARLW